MKDIIILFISIFIFLIIFLNIFFKKKEGFSLNDIDNMFDDVKNITKVVDDNVLRSMLVLYKEHKDETR